MDILRDMGVQGPEHLETRMTSASCHFPLMLRHMFKLGTALGKDTKETEAGVQSVHCGVGSAACRHPNPVSISPTASRARPQAWPVTSGHMRVSGGSGRTW